MLAAISRVLPRPVWRALLPSPETLLRWHRELVRRKWAAYRRRPRRQRLVLRSELHDLIVKLAEQNPRWGYRRIQGELVKLGHRCSHWTVRKVLRRHGLLPAPRRSQRSWREFVHQHADLHLPATGAWVAQQARNLAWKLQNGALRARFLLPDRDSKFSAAFDEVFKSEDVRVIRLPYRRPVANSIAEWFVGTCRREVLVLVFGRSHLERVLGEFI